MCFLGLETLRFLTILFAFLLAICNMAGICVSIKNLDNSNKQIRIIMGISLAFDLLINLAICLGIYGVLRNIVTCIYLFICLICCYFVGKIVAAKSIVNFDDKDAELILSVWYQFDVVFAGFCLMTASPFSLKLAEKPTDVA